VPSGAMKRKHDGNGDAALEQATTLPSCALFSEKAGHRGEARPRGAQRVDFVQAAGRLVGIGGIAAFSDTVFKSGNGPAYVATPLGALS